MEQSCPEAQETKRDSNLIDALIIYIMVTHTRHITASVNQPEH